MSSPTVQDNLFERWDLDPGASPQTITERLRELLLEAEPREQEQLRHAWEELTVHPRRRIAEALATYPETRPPLGRAPRAGGPAAPAPSSAQSSAQSPAPDGAIERLIHAPVTAALGKPPALPPALPRFDEDPLVAQVGTKPPRTPNGGHT